MTTPPERPEHPDFWLISQAVIDNDVTVDDGTSLQDATAPFVDFESVFCAALQRAQRVSGIMPESTRRALAVVWVDAFVTGVRYERLKSTGAQQFRDPRDPGESGESSGESGSRDER